MGHCQQACTVGGPKLAAADGRRRVCTEIENRSPRHHLAFACPASLSCSSSTCPSQKQSLHGRLPCRLRSLCPKVSITSHQIVALGHTRRRRLRRGGAAEDALSGLIVGLFPL